MGKTDFKRMKEDSEPSIIKSDSLLHKESCVPVKTENPEIKEPPKPRRIYFKSAEEK